MTQPDIHVHADLEALSLAAADRFIEIAEQRISQFGRVSVALSGGSTPRRMLEFLGSIYANRVDWSNVQIFQVDERMAAPDEASSNFRMMRESLLTRAPIPPENVFRMMGELEPEDAAERYAKALDDKVPKTEHGVPRFDLILLGMGSDGHVASIFPGSSLLGEKVRWTAVSEPGPEGLIRITLTLPVLTNAAQIIFVVSGAEKAETLARAVADSKSRDPLPVEFVLRSGVPVSWYIDRAAASGMHLG